MIKIEIPCVKTIIIEHLVTDYNGTLAQDGKLLESVSEKLNKLSEQVKIFVITADTFGKATENLKDINCELHIIAKNSQAEAKLEFIKNLGADKVCAIGNGNNDELMLKGSVLGIAVEQGEGLATKSLIASDIVCKSITDALDLLLNPKRLVATLRK